MTSCLSLSPAVIGRWCMDPRLPTGSEGLSRSLALAALVCVLPQHNPTLAQAGECYKMTYQKEGEDKPQKIRTGKPLDPLSPDFVALCATAQKLKDLNMRCPIMPPPGTPPVAPGTDPPPAGTPPIGVGEFMEDMLANGDICKESTADPKKVGATASNPVTGNGDGYTTTGHPGMNFNTGSIPTLGSSGFDCGEQMGTIGQFLHELSHIYDPMAEGTLSAKEWEDRATSYAIKEMCKIAECDDATQEEKDGACDFILTQNRQRCDLGLDQICCDACPDGGKIHCEGQSGGGQGAGDRGGQGSSGGGQEDFIGTQSIFLDTTTTEYYQFEVLRGSITLNVGFQEIAVQLRDLQHAKTYGTIDLTQTPDFLAVSFTALSGTELLVGGFDPVAGGAKLVRVDFNPYSLSQSATQTTMLHDTSMVVASSMDTFPTGPNVAISDHKGDAVYIYNRNTNSMTPVASSLDSPLMSSMNFVHVWTIPGAPLLPAAPQGPGNLSAASIIQGARPRGTLIWFTEWHEAGMGNGTLVAPNVRIIDRNGDGIYEEID